MNRMTNLFCKSKDHFLVEIEFNDNSRFAVSRVLTWPSIVYKSGKVYGIENVFPFMLRDFMHDVSMPTR